MNMPPGWYPDPSGDPSLMRWWDGEEWTGDFAPAQQVTPDGNRIRRGAYPMTNGDRNLRLAAFILNIISMVALGWTLLPLAWMSPMTVMSWGIYKGTRANTVAFGVCNLLFMNAIFFGGGVPVSNKER